MQISGFVLGWIIGLIEGEGCFDFNQNGPSSAYPNRYLRLRVVSTDLDVLERFRNVLGVGTIYEEKQTPGWKRCWRYTVTGPTVREIIDIVYPHLSIRRREIIDQMLADQVRDNPTYVQAHGWG